MAKILILGGGGREHSIALYLSRSSKVDKIFILPGNAGTDKEAKCINIRLPTIKGDEIATWCRINAISLVVIGPEEPLIMAVSDELRLAGIPCFGPNASAARLEGSKRFGKEIMRECGIPTAKYSSFSDMDAALGFLRSSNEGMRIIKADGIAAGKGVTVTQSLAEAEAAVMEMLDKQNPKFGSQSSEIIIEEELVGPEISILAFTDGVNVRCFPPCQDHKRVFDGDCGPNTGGMGAYCPCDLIDEETFVSIEVNIIQRVVDHMRKIGCPYQGILYAGLMITEEGPRVLEFNCRFGDPETQVLLPILKTDLFEVMLSCATLGGMKDLKVEFYDDRYALCVVLASGGYPGSYSKDRIINGLDKKHRCVDLIHAGTILNEQTGEIVTSGGRVLSVVATSEQLKFSYNLAMTVAASVDFEGCFYRKDIGYKALLRTDLKHLTYATAGVNIAAGDEFVKHIKSIVAKTDRIGTVSEIGQFGAVFNLKQLGYKEPLLVSGTDGVGTKLKVALTMNKHDTIGQDLVAMCVNDILCHGAEPLFFLDYFASGKLNLPVAQSVMSGIASACQLAGCTLIGGETAEMPGMYLNDDYDLAGFVVGAVEKDDLLPRLDKILSGDSIIGLSSSGLHSNGFSLVRKVISTFDMDFLAPFGDSSESTLGSTLLTPTIIYVKPLLKLLRESSLRSQVRSLCHITGGGLPGNLPRSLPQDMKAVLDTSLWHIPDVFGWLWRNCGQDIADFSKTFNLGIGMSLIVSSESAKDICGYLSSECGLQSTVIGHVVTRDHLTDNRVVLKGLQRALDVVPASSVPRTINTKKKRVGVLISGSGTNLQALLKYSKDHPLCSYEIVVVISNVANVKGLDIASMYGVRSMVIDHKSYASRSKFDEELQRVLTSEELACELVCLAGFMRILGKEVTEKWHGRIINIHPSLLPSFRGAHAHRQVLSSGVRVTGATVHFVVAEVDSGGIIAQAATDVCVTDTEETLSERVKSLIEHTIFPLALNDVAKGVCWLGLDNLVQWRR